MFDTVVYDYILKACVAFLERNRGQLGEQFCQAFIVEHNLSRGQSGYAQQLFNYVSQASRQVNGPQGRQTLNDDQLFQVVGNYIQQMVNSQMQSRPLGFNQPSVAPGFGQSTMQPGFQNSGSMMGGFGGGGGFGQPNRPMGAGSHLMSDTPAQTQSPLKPNPVAMSPVAQPQEIAAMPVFSANPLDGITDPDTRFSLVDKTPVWLGEPKDDRFLLVTRKLAQTPSSAMTIVVMECRYQPMHNDPLAVAKDFFDTAPDSEFGNPLIARILYQHLDVLQVPTSDMIAIRDQCVEIVKAGRADTLYRRLLDIFDTMPRGAYTALSSYLTGHINRALYLNCRVLSSPKTMLQIESFDDLRELLSSSFNHKKFITDLPEGRRFIEQIVSRALWNVLVENSLILFENKAVIPTNTMQSSSVFPYSMSNVYPNKYAIPTSDDAKAPEFVDRLWAHELTKRSYIVTQRVAVVTNILGRTVLSNVTAVPTTYTTPPGALLNAMALRLHSDAININGLRPVVPYASEDYPTDQLDDYYTNSDYMGNLIDQPHIKRNTILPIDSTIFAVQYSVSPYTYLTALDVFTAMDTNPGAGQVILAKRDLPAVALV